MGSTNVNWQGNPAKPARSPANPKLGGTPTYRNPSGPARTRVPGVNPPATGDRSNGKRTSGGKM